MLTTAIHHATRHDGMSAISCARYKNTCGCRTPYPVVLLVLRVDYITHTQRRKTPSLNLRACCRNPEEHSATRYAIPLPLAHCSGTCKDIVRNANFLLGPCWLAWLCSSSIQGRNGNRSQNRYVGRCAATPPPVTCSVGQKQNSARDGVAFGAVSQTGALNRSTARSQPENRAPAHAWIPDRRYAPAGEGRASQRGVGRGETLDKP